ncbi:MAG: hypothetical protein RIB67_00250 [Miltoncostaeaceae bacterium]
MGAHDRPGAADRIARALAEGAPLGVAELVERTGLHENAVRRNLARMVDAGRVHSERAPAAGGRGRPRLLYRAVGGAERPYAELLPLVLELLATGGTDGGGAAHRLGRAHGRATAGAGSATEAVTATLADLGFAPSRSGAHDIALGACPFADQVLRPGGRALCALHHGIVAGVALERGGEVTAFTANDPNRAPCTLSVRDTPSGDQEAGNSATSARKASPRSP